MTIDSNSRPPSQLTDDSSFVTGRTSGYSTSTDSELEADDEGALGPGCEAGPLTRESQVCRFSKYRLKKDIKLTVLFQSLFTVITYQKQQRFHLKNRNACICFECLRIAEKYCISSTFLIFVVNECQFFFYPDLLAFLFNLIKSKFSNFTEI